MNNSMTHTQINIIKFIMELVPWERCNILQKFRGWSDHCTGEKRLLAPEGKNHAYVILLTRAYHRVQEELNE